MVMPIGHAREVEQLVPLQRRDRRAIVIGGTLTLAAIVALILVLATGGNTRPPGCLHVDVPSTMGAGELRPCGAAARDLCREATVPPLGATADGATIRAACRRARIAAAP
jgi:hypothetical protein